jgi:hypothetical protein
MYEITAKAQGRHGYGKPAMEARIRWVDGMLRIRVDDVTHHEFWMEMGISKEDLLNLESGENDEGVPF